MSYHDYEEWWKDYHQNGFPQNKELRIAITKEPLLEVRTTDPVEKGRSSIGKPKGLWYSFGAEWLDWCLDEGGAGFLGNYVYTLEVDPAKMLKLSTLGELYDFTKQHFIPFNDLFPDSKVRRESFGVESRMGVIDWKKVAESYSGVEVYPYHWEARLDPATFWYYSWDVASGCIWEPSAVTGYTLIAECPIPKPKRRKENANEEVSRERSG